MLSPEEVVRRLRESGALWEIAAGVSGLRGPVVSLAREIESALAFVARAETSEEWIAPAAVSFETLERAQYFASFPQWLTAASHLSGNEKVLESIAVSASPAAVARSSLARADVVLPPAICYNTYAAYADTSIEAPVIMTAQGACWRHEGEKLAPLERGWAFTMREIVCLGAQRDVKEFLDRTGRVLHPAHALVPFSARLHVFSVELEELSQRCGLLALLLGLIHFLVQDP